MSARVVVVGGGPAGLSAAWHLQRRGADVHVLEAQPTAGGKVRSRRSGAWLCEAGPEGWLDSERDAGATRRIVEGVGLVPEQVRASEAAGHRRFIFRQGRLHVLPTGPVAFARSSLLSAGGKFRLLREPFVDTAAGDESVAAFTRRHLGDEVLAALVHPFVSGIYAGDPEELSLAAAFPKLATMVREHGSVVRGAFAMMGGALRQRRSGASPRRETRLTSFTSGMESLPDALSRSLGGRVRCGVAAERVEPLAGAVPGGARWRVYAGGGHEDCEHVVVAIPSAPAARVVERASPELAGRLAEIPWSACAVVGIGAPVSAFPPGTLDGFGWLAARGEPLRSLGVLWSSSIFPAHAPEGHVLFRAIFGGARDGAAVELPDDDLVATALDDLWRALGVRVEPVFRHVERWPLAIPRYALGHLERLWQLDAALGALPGLHLTGQSYRGVGVNDVLRESEALAERIAG